MLHAPTATAERLGLPARLIAPLPLEPDRRRVRPGPAADAVLGAAAAAYLDLVRDTPPEQRMELVPRPGFPRSELDGQLRELLLDALRGAAWLPGAAGAELVPGRAEWLDLPGRGAASCPRCSPRPGSTGCWRRCPAGRCPRPRWPSSGCTG